jgi:hypothetical protein
MANLDGNLQEEAVDNERKTSIPADTCGICYHPLDERDHCDRQGCPENQPGTKWFLFDHGTCDHCGRRDLLNGEFKVDQYGEVTDPNPIRVLCGSCCGK